MPGKTVPITAIRVGKRHRKDLGDIRSLARSIQEIGFCIRLSFGLTGNSLRGNGGYEPLSCWAGRTCP
jgi:hypothetical protein